MSNPWWMAARPATLSASIAPVLVGSAHAVHDSVQHWPAALAALTGALFIQVGTNFINDVEDFERGADDEHRKGPARAVEQGLLRPQQVRRAAAFAFFGACLAGVYLIHVSGWPILLLGVLSILSGVAYTAGPWPLAYLGLGDLFVLAFFGIAAVCGTYFVQAGSLTPSVVASGAAVGALATAILAVNNTRDVENDQRAGKRTLAVRFGPTATKYEYAVLVCFACTTPLLLAIQLDSITVLLPLVLLPLVPGLIRRVFSKQGEELNPLLGDTARFELVFAVLLAIGLCL